MADSVYRLTSPVTPIIYTGSEPPGACDFENWTLRELYDPPDGNKPHTVGAYRLAIERALSTSDDPIETHYEAIEFSKRVERVWPYATGIALRRSPIGRKLAIVQPRKGWSSNVDDVQAELARARGGGRWISGVSGGTRSFSTIGWWPLDRIVVGLAAEENLTEVERELIELHQAANESSSSRAYSVLLSSGLEIVREMLPGKTKAERQASLPQSVQQSLVHSLDELFARANQRRETRHAITKTPVLGLHPSMTSNEHIDYLRDVDAVIRYAISNRLGLAMVHIEPS